MEKEKNLIEPLFEKVEQYTKTSFELLKLKALDKAATSISSLGLRCIIVLIFSMFLFLVNIGLAIWLGELLGKVYYGFFCIAGFYVIVLGVLSLFMDNWIKQLIGNSIISNVLNGSK